ncbi:hypothetical protein HDU98_010065 [Podochytrium sp. JEL0797]|nr:hypothetical protein HDU98_010065 [Podochytrium sp. JEL0797]
MFTIDRLPFQRHFRTPILSQATLLAVLLSFATLVLPLVWAYAGNSFWLKMNTFQTQPAVTFMRDAMLILDGVDSTTGVAYSYFYSTNPMLNQMYESSVHSVPTIKAAELDENNDGVSDVLTFTIGVALFPTDTIRRVRVAMFLRYDLDSVARMTMQSAILIDESTGLSGAALHVHGDLRIVQRELLVPTIDNYAFNRGVLNYSMANGGDSGARADDFTWTRMVDVYEKRNIRTKLEISTPPAWTSPRAVNQAFMIHGTVRYSPDVFLYQPTVMEVLKVAWMQYLAYFVIMYMGCRYTFQWAVRSGVVASYVVVDVMPRQDGFRGHIF